MQLYCIVLYFLRGKEIVKLMTNFLIADQATDGPISVSRVYNWQVDLNYIQITHYLY
jgi:hypothetical protein